MDNATQWWLENTPAGRRTLERIVPRSALSPRTRRQICAERGHDTFSSRDGRCARCGETIEERRR